jgi:hypothetical protein
VTAVIQPLMRTGEHPLVTRTRLRAQQRARWLRHLWSLGTPEAEQWMAIGHHEVDRILLDPGDVRRAEAAFAEQDGESQALERQIAAAESALATDRRWRTLHDELAVSGTAADLLALCVAAEADPLLHRVFAYLHDDATAGYPTPWLAASLFGGAATDPRVASGLLRWSLARPADRVADPWSASTGWTADTNVTRWLLDGADLEPPPPATLTRGDVDAPAVCLYPDVRAAALDFLDSMGRCHPVEIELVARAGSGRRTLAHQIAAALQRPFVAASTGDAPAEHAERHVAGVARAAVASGGILWWDVADDTPPGVEQLLHGRAPVTLFGRTSVVASISPVPRRTFTLDPLPRRVRLDLWGTLLDRPVPRALADWNLTPAEITSAASVTAAGDEAMVEAARRALALNESELLSTLPCPYGREDIVLTADLQTHLDELEAQASLRGEVYDEWGFGRLVPLGRGVTAMFSGPSGTGKTMAAQVLARSLGVPLYRVDLAGVVNKYIGETEKRLKQVFDACERANVVLLFDEADALFGQRTQVKDAHDRFANIEIDYLLQRMEQFDGLAVLATNRKADMDKAFLRRLRFIIDFVPPGPPERRRLWRLALPAAAPDGTRLLSGIDFEWLARRLTMTGADIKAAALAAAFLARAAGSRIDMKLVVHAARREMAKHGAELTFAGEDMPWLR